MSGAPADRLLDAAVAARRAAGLAVGMPRALWSHLTFPLPVHRIDRRHAGPDPGPTDRPVGGDADDVQPRASGAGPSLRRRYSIRIGHPYRCAEDVIALVRRDPNVAAPFRVARFVKTSGRLGRMRVGDEYLVWMPGPWNGPVRVANVTATSFRLSTLRGHMEAGEIEFRARDVGGDSLIFTIESSARSGSRPFWLVYGPLRVAREAQLHMWVQFCAGVARLAGGTPGPVTVETHTYPDDTGAPVARRVSPRARRALEALRDRPVNVPETSLEDPPPGEGWLVDDHTFPLGGETPGPPSPDGPFVVARDLIRAYEFADPRLIRAVYNPDDPLDQRTMLLEGRFLGMTFHLGARVVHVTEDVVGDADGAVDRWGWGYRTLQGHLEMGQMDFWVVKHRGDGRVEFRIHAVSRPAPIPNPLVRFGFRLFGRGLQLRFARTAGARLQALTEQRMADAPLRDAEPAPSVAPVAPPEAGSAPGLR